MKRQCVQVQSDMGTNEGLFQGFFVKDTAFRGHDLAIGSTHSFHPNGTALFVSQMTVVQETQRVIVIHDVQSLLPQCQGTHSLAVGVPPNQSGG